MKRFALPGLACALALTFIGCGPMQTPMPPRLDPDSQKQVDDSWNKAFEPVSRFDRKGLLDVMVGVQAYQLGVDSFALRSEKRFAGGKVVMPKTDIGPPGFIALVRDTEGNVVGLHSERA